MNTTLPLHLKRARLGLAATSLAVATALLCPQELTGQNAFCVAAPNASGGVDLPVACPFSSKTTEAGLNFGTSGRGTVVSLDGLPPGEPVRRELTLGPLQNIVRTPGGNLGGEIVTGTCAVDEMLVTLGYGVMITGMTVNVEIHVESLPAPLGDFHRVSTELVSISGTQNGHPELGTVTITGGSSSGRPCPGETVLVRNPPPSGNFRIDSFFDVWTEISISGGSTGISGTISGFNRISQNSRCLNGVCAEPLGDAAVTQGDADTLTVSNIGSSGEDGVSITAGSRKGYQAYQARAEGGINASAPGRAVCFSFVSRLVEHEGVSFNSTLESDPGGGVAGRCQWPALLATETLVEIWQGPDLVGSAVVPVSGPAFTCDSPVLDGFRHEVSGDGCVATWLTFQAAGTAPTITPTGGSPLSGNRVRLSPYDPQRRVEGIVSCDVTGTNLDPIIFDDLQVGLFDHAVRGGGGAVLSQPGGGRLKVSNLGSSGCDSGSIDLGGGGSAPVEIEVEKLHVRQEFGPVTMRLDTFSPTGADLGWMAIEQTAAGTTEVKADFSSVGDPNVRVEVYLGDQFQGNLDVTGGGAVVAELAEVAGSEGALITSCGKRVNLPPWITPCLYCDYDRPLTITPTGGSPLTGDSLRILAVGANASIDSLRRLEVSTSQPEFDVCGISSEPGPRHLPVRTESAPFENTEFSSTRTIIVPGDDPGYGLLLRKKKHRRPVQTGSTAGCLQFSATLELEVEGLGTLAGLSRTLSLPATYELCPGQNPFTGQPVQQFPVVMRNFQASLPAGDPDFDLLTVSALGDSPGQTVLREAVCGGGNFNVDSFFDIDYQIEFQGTAGGGAAGPSGLGTNLSDTLRAAENDQTYYGHVTLTRGSAHLATGATGNLVVSNIGSSGNDGVAFDFGGGVQGVDIELTPLQLDVGGSLRLEAHGEGEGIPAGGSLGHVEFQRNGNAVYDATVDYTAVSAEAVTIQIYDQGALVQETQVTGPTASFEVSDLGTGLPPFKGCGKLPALSSTPCYRAKLCDRAQFAVPGQPPVEGDEMRLLACCHLGHSDTRVFRMAIEAASPTGGEIEITDISLIQFGRTVSARGPIGRRTEIGYDAGLVVDLDPDDDDAGPGGEVEFRPPLSRVLNGRKQMWPLDVQTEGLNLARLGDTLTLEACGTIAGTEDASYGTLTLAHDGTEIVTTADFSSRGVSQVHVSVHTRHLDKSSTKLAEANVPTSGPLLWMAPESIRSVSAIPEGYPPPDSIECFYSVDFEHPTEVRLPGQAPVFGTRIEVQLVAPTDISEDISCLRLRGSGLKPFLVTGVGSGPFVHHGVPHATLGSGQVEDVDGLENYGGNLIVHNIGSSGNDGVRVDLSVAEGVRMKCEPIDLFGPGSSMTIGTCLRWDGDDCDDSDDGDGLVLLAPGDHEPFVFYDIILRTSGGGGGGTGPATVAIYDAAGNRYAGNLPGGGSLRVTPFGAVQPGIVEYGIEPRDLRGLRAVGGLSNARYFLEFDEVALVDANDGTGPHECIRLEVYPSPWFVQDESCKGIFDQAWTFDTRLGGIDEMTITGAEILDHGGNAFESDGNVELVATEEGLQVSNIGSSGQDGTDLVLRKRPGRTKYSNITLKRGLVASTGGGGGRIALVAKAKASGGGAPLPAGTCGIDIPQSGPFSFDADFSDLGTGSCRVRVCDDGVCIAEQVLPTSAALGSISSLSGEAIDIVGCGKLAQQPIPGGSQTPCFRWRFGSRVRVQLAGQPPADGDELQILAEGATVPVDDLASLGMRATSLEGLVLTEVPANSFYDHLVANYTDAEIEGILLCVDWCGDLDADGAGPIQEWVTGGDPHLADAAERAATTSVSAVAGGNEVTFSYQSVPELDGVETRIDLSTDLQVWDTSESQFDLLEVWQLTNGNYEFVYRYIGPPGTRLFHRRNLTLPE